MFSRLKDMHKVIKPTITEVMMNGFLVPESVILGMAHIDYWLWLVPRCVQILRSVLS